MQQQNFKQKRILCGLFSWWLAHRHGRWDLHRPLSGEWKLMSLVSHFSPALWPGFVLEPWALPVFLPSSVVQAIAHSTAWVTQRPCPSASTAECYRWQESKCSICGDKKERCHVASHLISCFLWNLLSVLTSIQQADRREKHLFLLPLHLFLALQQCLTDQTSDWCFSIVCIISCWPLLNPW